MKKKIVISDVGLVTFCSRFSALLAVFLLLWPAPTQSQDLFQTSPQPLQWPEITREHKPWTRWWWQGSSVNEETLSHLLEEYQKAGLGGFEITPIYGVYGLEEEFVDFLSPEWVRLLVHTLDEAERLDLGIDMATGSGWPFGGPMVGDEEAPRNVLYRTWTLNEGETLGESVQYTQEPMVRAIGTQVYELHGFLGAEGEDPEGTVENPLQLPGREPIGIEDIVEPISANENLQALAFEQVRIEKELPLITLMAYSDDGDVRDLTGYVDSAGRLDWTASGGSWTLYALFQGWHGKMVERAAPGGEGFVIDHFSKQAIRDYLMHFDEAFEGSDLSGLRGFFNDSYEVDDASGQANWTPGFFDSFDMYRGYDLREHLPALFGNSSEDENERVTSDYRETISDLLLDTFTQEWRSWANDRGAIVRNQAHGSPANILDLYAASDIPETEGRELFRAKMASSAGNVTGKRLISTEASTWLDEHFLSTLADVKQDVDQYFLAGVNHVVYHGTAYSPPDEAWPGRLFYAAVHFNPQNPFWNHFRTFNEYVSRVQSLLQSGLPANDVLLYFPIYDRWSAPGNNLLEHFSGGIEDQFEGTIFLEAAEVMQERGFGFDFVSDRQIRQTSVSDNLIRSGDASYKTILLPHSRYIPLETVEAIMEMAERGATIISVGGFPDAVSGFADHEAKTDRYLQMTEGLQFGETGREGVSEARVGEGVILQGDDTEQLLAYAGIEREPMTDPGLQFVRRSHDDGHLYFVKNTGEQPVDQFVGLAVDARSVVLFDPVTGVTGAGRLENTSSQPLKVRLQLNPGESIMLKTYTTELVDSGVEQFPYMESAGSPLQLAGNWGIRFTEGGPELPDPVETDELVSWTEFGGEAVGNYSGRAVYTHTFEMPESEADGWLLDLGEVYNSANVRLNGVDAGTLVGLVFQLFVDRELFMETNVLEVEVANLMANRIAWMDREDIPWKRFYNVNFPARLGSNRGDQGLFDASEWGPRDSGLVGPVSLTPVVKSESEN